MEVEPGRVMVFIDGENFLYGIRKLFYAEFDRSEYLPQNAEWGWFFAKLAEGLKATEFSVRWYVIDELDFHPYADWENESWEDLRRMLPEGEFRDQFRRKTSEKGRRNVLERFRKLCMQSQHEMEKRLAQWHEMQNAISTRHPFVRFYRPGWQPCYLPDRKLGREKGIDIGLAVDLVRKQPDYDLAVLFSGDGDYVPAVNVIHNSGKKVALMEFEFRSGEALRGTSRRLRARADVMVDVPFDDLTRFLGIDSPVG
jgi:uncharacterized LabA/DUF88 family protein